MSKAVKSLESTEIKNRCAGVDSACVIDISGLDAISTNVMRGGLKKLNISMHVLKNSMARRALADSPLKPLAQTLAGPCALVYGEPAIMDIAKELSRWAQEYKVITLKNAIMEGDADLLTVADLSKMKSRTELIADIAAAVAGPGRSIAAQLLAPAGNIAGCLKTLIEKNETAETAEAA